MRRFVAVLCLLLGGVFLFAAARVPEPGPAPPAPREEYRPEVAGYARELFYVTGEVTAHYYRPVARGDLLEAAVQGLYEEARVPVPPGLLADARKASTEQDVTAVLVRARLQVGDPEPLRGTNALLASCRGLTRVLDPYSCIVTGEELRRGNGVDEQSGVGLELVDNLGTGPQRVKAVLPGGPAQEAGIRPGDEITHLDGAPVQGKTSAEVVFSCNCSLPNPPGPLPASAPDTVELTLRRPGVKEPRKVTLERREFTPETVLGVRRRDNNSWDYWLDREHGLGELRLSGLGNGTALRVREVVTALRAEGLRGLLLDLRWCPGGYLRESVNVAALFLGAGNVATVRSRTEKDVPFPSTAEHKFLDFPILVLVNGETSGGAELIAAALQDHGRAVVAGQRTRGKASIQTVLPLGLPEGGLKLTTGTFLRPSGKNLHRSPDSKLNDDWGVRPEPRLELRVSRDLDRRLQEWWQLQMLRPGSSTEALPLDDPDADPQHQAAVAALLARVGK